MVDSTKSGQGGGDPGDRAQRVLVLDDDRDAADGLALLMELRGYETRVAYDAASALELLEAEPADAIVSDLGLPVLDGYEFARILRRERGCRSCLIALSGHADPDSVERAREAGYDHHLVKPVDTDLLWAALAVSRPETDRVPGRVHFSSDRS